MFTNTKSPIMHRLYRAELKTKIAKSQEQIRTKTQAKIIHRTQAINSKRPYQTIEEERCARQEILAEQIKIWRRVMPTLLKKLSRIPDPRRTKSIKHKMVVLMIFGLIAFVFRLSSRREMNRELTGQSLIHSCWSKSLRALLDGLFHQFRMTGLDSKSELVRLSNGA